MDALWKGPELRQEALRVLQLIPTLPDSLPNGWRLGPHLIHDVMFDTIGTTFVTADGAHVAVTVQAQRTTPITDIVLTLCAEIARVAEAYR